MFAPTMQTAALGLSLIATNQMMQNSNRIANRERRAQAMWAGIVSSDLVNLD